MFRLDHTLPRAPRSVSFAALLTFVLGAAQPLAAHAQAGDPKYFVEYTGTADFSTSAQVGITEHAGVASDDYGLGSYDLHLVWTAIGSGLFADAPFSDEPSFDPNASLGFTVLSGTISYALPNSPPVSTAANNCTGGLRVVPGARLPYWAYLRPTANQETDYFTLRTVLPLSATYVQTDNMSSLYCSTLDHGPNQPNIVKRLPDFPALTLEGAWNSAVAPLFFPTTELH
jgi:hypothetical protein